MEVTLRRKVPALRHDGGVLTYQEGNCHEGPLALAIGIGNRTTLRLLAANQATGVTVRQKLGERVICVTPLSQSLARSNMVLSAVRLDRSPDVSPARGHGLFFKCPDTRLSTLTAMRELGHCS